MDARNPTAPLVWRRALLVLFVCLGLTLALSYITETQRKHAPFDWAGVAAVAAIGAVGGRG